MEINVSNSFADGNIPQSESKTRSNTLGEKVSEQEGSGVVEVPTENFGQYLRRLRESRELTLDQIFALTKIAPRMITAIEENRTKDLPSKPFIRGFLRALSRPLRVPSDELIARYEAATVPVVSLNSAVSRRSTMSATMPPGLRRLDEWIGRKMSTHNNNVLGFLPATLAGWTALLLVLVLGSVGGWMAWQKFSPVESQAVIAKDPQQVQSEVVSKLEQIETPNQKPTQMQAASATESTKPVVEPILPEKLVMEAKKDTWLKLAIDRKGSSEIFLKAGEKREFRAATSFDLLLGNAAGVILTYNGKLLEPMGAEGSVKRLVLPQKPVVSSPQSASRETRAPVSPAVNPETTGLTPATPSTPAAE